jgi:hypothetical protein
VLEYEECGSMRCVGYEVGVWGVLSMGYVGVGVQGVCNMYYVLRVL